jgi:glutaryl-CoA dehydrogenase
MTGATVTREVGEALATDYFLIRDQLTDEQYGRFIETRRFVDREVLPVIAGYWERAQFPGLSFRSWPGSASPATTSRATAAPG